jgi:hypothetical protein
MKTFRTTVAAAALFAALVGCGTSVSGSASPAPPPPAPPTPSAPPVDPAEARQNIETAFRDYYEALRDEDFAAACAFHAPETTERLLAKLRGRGVTAESCEEALTAVYAVPGNAEQVESIGQSAIVDDITVTGENAEITWSADVNGGRETTTSALRRIDGRWLLLATKT